MVKRNYAEIAEANQCSDMEHICAGTSTILPKVLGHSCYMWGNQLITNTITHHVNTGPNLATSTAQTTLSPNG